MCHGLNLSKHSYPAPEITPAFFTAAGCYIDGQCPETSYCDSVTKKCQPNGCLPIIGNGVIDEINHKVICDDGYIAFPGSKENSKILANVSW